MPEPRSSVSPDRTRMAGPRFRIHHLLYAMAVLSAALVTFGEYGFAMAFAILIFWAAISLNANRSERWLGLCIGAVTTIILTCLLLPPIEIGRSEARRAECIRRLKQINLALHAYHEHYGAFPPAYIADDEGRRMHSWRVLILPYMDQVALYKKYRFDEPWDGPNNRLLLASRPDVFACPADNRHRNDRDTHTNYVAVVGPDTAWPGGRSMSLEEIGGDASAMTLLLETFVLDIPWLEPRDVKLDEAVALFAETKTQPPARHSHHNFLWVYQIGGYVLSADGQVRSVPPVLPEARVRALFASHDNTTHDKPSFDTIASMCKRPRTANWYRLVVFLSLALLPVPWLWRKRRYGTSEIGAGNAHFAA